MPKKSEKNPARHGRKTTLLKSKMVSLAYAGEKVTYVILGGEPDTNFVLSIATKIQMENHPNMEYHQNICVLSYQDLVKYFRDQNPWYKILPSGLGLLKFYVQKARFKNV